MTNAANIYDHIAVNNCRTAFILCIFPAALFLTVYLFAILYAEFDNTADVMGSALQSTLKYYPYFVLLFAPSAYDMVKIKRGTFRDEEGSFIRN